MHHCLKVVVHTLVMVNNRYNEYSVKSLEYEH